MKKVFNFVKKKKRKDSDSISVSSSLASLHQPSSSQTTYNVAPPTSIDPSLPTVLAKTALKFHNAVYYEDLDKVKKILSSSSSSKDSINLNIKDNYGRNVIHHAASNGNVAILWQLLNNHGASSENLHHIDVDGATALHRAIDAGHSEAAQMLLDKGCPLDVSDVKNKDTALHLSIRGSFHDLSTVLCRKGANPDLINRAGDTPLTECIRGNQIPLAQLLLRFGADVNIKGKDGITPLMLACTRPKPSGELLEAFVEQLLDYEANPEDVDHRGWDAQRYANEMGYLEVIELIQRYIDRRRRNDDDHRDEEDHSFDDLSIRDAIIYV